MTKIVTPEKVTLTATWSDNHKDYELRGTATEIKLDTDRRYEWLHHDSMKFLEREEITLTTQFFEGYELLVKEKSELPPVSMQARVHSKSKSVKHLEDARKRAGAPEDAQVFFVPDLFANAVDTPYKVVVEFTWEVR